VKSSDKVQYELKRSKRRKYLALSVRDTGDVVVKAPFRVSKASIDMFVAQHAAWISRQQGLCRQLPPPLKPHTYDDHDEFLFLGETLALTLQPPYSGRTYCRRSGQKLFVYRHHRASQGAVKRAVEQWYRDEGIPIFRSLVTKWCTKLSISPIPDIQIHDYRRRWGSCSQTGTISFALRALMLEIRLLDYLALHETAHLLHFNHGNGFTHLLDEQMPDWRMRKQEMTRLRMMASRV